MHKYNFSKSLIHFFFSCCAALMLCMDFANSNVPANSTFEEIFYSLTISINEEALLLTLLTIFFFYISRRMHHTTLPCPILFKMASLGMGVLWLMGESFQIDNTLQHISSTRGQCVKSIIYLIGATFLIELSLRILYYCMEQKKDFTLPSSSKFTPIISWCKTHFFATSVFALLACWAIPVITCYPANLCNDTWIQLSQFWGFSEFTSHHPPVQTLIFGFFTWLGTLVGHANIGLYLFILVQTTLYALTIAYSFVLMRKLAAPKWLLLLTFIAAGFTPYYANRVSMLLKDNLYSISVLLFIIELVYALLNAEDFLSKKKHLALTAISILGVILFRNNGKHILYPTLLILGIVLICKRRSIAKKTFAKGLLLLTVPVVLASIITATITSVYHIQKGSLGEALSFPFQQTARCVYMHPGDITTEEMAAISAVLDYNVVATQYTPFISDPIKATFNRDATTAELLQYFKTWGTMFFKYPQTYIEASVAQSYYLIYPFENNDAIYMRFNDFSEELMAPLKEQVGLAEVTTFKTQKEILIRWFSLMHNLPIIGMLSHTAPYTIILFFLILLALCKKLYRFLLPATPIFLSVVVIILAPVIWGHPRYAFPIVYTVPLLIAYYMYLHHSNNTETSEK